MSYFVQMQIAKDQILLERITACAGLLGVANPSVWVYATVWSFPTQPGWVEAYRAALNAKVEYPGADESVITDQMILDAVQALYVPPTEAFTDLEPDPSE